MYKRSSTRPKPVGITKGWPHCETDVTDKGFVKNRVNNFAFVGTSFGKSLKGRAISFGKVHS